MPIIPTVFISYKWGRGDSGNDDFADKIENTLSGKATVIRDKSSIPMWGSISKFMESIRQQDFAVLIISNAYLRSTACLYEVVQLMKDDGWAGKTMNVVFDDAGIYDPQKRAEYIRYWEQKRLAMEQQLNGLPTDTISEMAEELKKLKIISLNIGEFMAKIADMINPSVESAISEIHNRVSARNSAVTPIASIEVSDDSPLPRYYKASDFTGSFLSGEAITLLINASDDPSGGIYKIRSIIGLRVEANGHNFIQTNNRREEARWEAAISELSDDDIIEVIDRRNGFYQLTNYGYEVADELRQQVTSL